MLAKARGADPARGADGDQPLLLAAGPVSEALLRLVGSRGLDALMATRCALQRKARELAADVAWRVGKIWIRPGRVAAWAVRFPSTRAHGEHARDDASACHQSRDGRGRHAEARDAEPAQLQDRQRGREGASGRADSCERRGRGCAGQGAAGVCDIGSEGAAALVKALPPCAKLAKLNVGSNSIGAEGKAALRAAAAAVGRRLRLEL